MLRFDCDEQLIRPPRQVNIFFGILSISEQPLLETDISWKSKNQNPSGEGLCLSHYRFRVTAENFAQTQK